MFNGIIGFRKPYCAFLAVILILSMLVTIIPVVRAGLGFSISMLVSNETTYSVGETPELWAQVTNTGTVTIPSYDLSATFSVVAPSGSIISAGLGWYGIADLQPGAAGVIINTDNPWTIPSGVEAGAYDISVTVTSASTSVSHSATNPDAFSINAPPPPDFTLYATPSSAAIEQGQTATFTVTVESVNGWNDPVDLSSFSTPIGSTVQFAPSTVTPSPTATSTLEIRTDTSTTVNTYNFLIRGTHGTLYHDWLGSSLTVKPRGSLTPDYQLSVDPIYNTVIQGQQTTFSITATAFNGYNSPVTLSTLVATSGLSLSFSGSKTATVVPTAGGQTVTLTLNADAATTVGKWYFIICGRDLTGMERQTSARIRVNSNIQGIIVYSLSTDKMLFNPTDAITFSFSVTGATLPIVLRPIIVIDKVGSWQAPDITLASGANVPVSLTVSRPSGWMPGMYIWGVALIGPPPSYANVVYYVKTTAQFAVFGNYYTITMRAKTTSESSIRGTEIYLGDQNAYRRFITEFSGVDVYFPSSSATYSATAMMYIVGESRPTTEDNGASDVGYIFDHWEFSGGVVASTVSSANTAITVSGNGVLTAYFARLNVRLTLTTPSPPNNILPGTPTDVVAQASIDILPTDLTPKCTARTKTIYLRASIEGWGSDESFDQWYQPASGPQAYSLTTGGDLTLTWHYSSLTPVPLPGTYSVNLFIFDGSSPPSSFPPTTGMISWKKLQYAFSFNGGQSYIEMYGDSQARVIHLHYSSDDVGNAKWVADMLQRIKTVKFAFLVAGAVTMAVKGGAEKAMIGLFAKVALTDWTGRTQAKKNSDGSYDYVIFQTKSGEEMKKKGAYYESPLVGADEMRVRDNYWYNAGQIVGLLTLAAILAVPSGGASLILLAVFIGAASLVFNGAARELDIPEELFQKGFEHLPAYAKKSFDTAVSILFSRASRETQDETNMETISTISVSSTYAPDGLQFDKVNVSSFPAQIFSKPGASVSISFNYTMQNPFLEGYDMQLLLVYSWGGGWPPTEYIGIAGGTADQEGLTTTVVNMPQTPGIYFGWFVTGTGSAFSDALQSFVLDLYATSVPHITFVVDDTTPATSDNYDESWRNSDFTIALTAEDNESGVFETYFRINSGSIMNVSLDGQPHIVAEGSNNTLQYWSVDKSGNEELHKVITGIKLDMTPPQIGVSVREPSGDVLPYAGVKVSTNVTDSQSFVKNVKLEYTTNRTNAWLEIPMALNSTTGLYQAAIPGQEPDTQVKYRILASDNAGNNETDDNAGQFYVFVVAIPEIPSTIILPLFMIAALIAVIFYRKKRSAGLRQKKLVARSFPE